MNDIDTNKSEALDSISFENQEKRLNIVFKIIYVVAAFWGVLFLEMGKDFEQGLSPIYIFLACIETLLLTVLLYMVAYVIKEMKCLSFQKKDNKIHINDAENSYSRIFTNLLCSGISALCLFFIGLTFHLSNVFSQKGILVSMGVAFGGWIIHLCVWHIYFKNNLDTKRAKITQTIGCILVNTTLFFAWLYMGTKPV